MFDVSAMGLVNNVTGTCGDGALTFEAEFLVQHRIPGTFLQVDADLRVGPEAAPDGPVLTSSLRMRCNSIHIAYTRKHSHNTHDTQTVRTHSM